MSIRDQAPRTATDDGPTPAEPATGPAQPPPAALAGPTRAPSGPAGVASAPVGAARRGHALALAVIVTCQLMVAVDGNIVNISLPAIQSGLGFSPAGLAWVFSAFSLAFGGLLLLGGRTSDLVGRRRMLMIGLVVMSIASLLGGLAPDQGLLVAARATQGIGFAFAAPAALSLIAVTFSEGAERNRALGVFSTVAGLGITIGLIAGGLLTTVSWRLVFFVNVPVGVAAILLARVVLPETERHRGRLDVIGGVTSTAGASALVYGLIHASSACWSDPVTAGALVLGVLLLAVFVVAERRSAQPLLPLWLLADRARAGAYAIFFLLFAAMTGTYFLLSLYVQDGLRYGPLRAGLAFLPMAVAQFITARSAPKLIPRFGAKALILAGALLMLADSVWLSLIGPHIGYAAGLLGPLVLLGAGLGLGFVPLNVTILAGLPPRDTGAASGLLQAVQQIGLSLGVAVLATVYATELAGTSRAVLTHALATAMIAAIAFSAAALLVGNLLIRRRR